MVCDNCGGNNAIASADLTGSVRGFFKSRIETELKVYLHCKQCGWADLILHEGQGRTL